MRDRLPEPTSTVEVEMRPGDLIQAVIDCQSVDGDCIEAGRIYTVAAVDSGGWPTLTTDVGWGGAWAPGQFRAPEALVTCGPPEGCTCPAVAWVCICGADPASRHNNVHVAAKDITGSVDRPDPRCPLCRPPTTKESA